MAAQKKVAKPPKPKPQPVYIVPRQQGPSVTRLGTPTAFIMLLGLLLVFYALRGWDAKYGTFNGAFAGKGAIPTGTRPRGVTASPVTSVPSSSTSQAQSA